MNERQDGKEDAPHQGERDANQCRKQPVAPVFGYCEGGEAGFPNAVEAVGAGRLGDHIFKVHLQTKTGLTSGSYDFQWSNDTPITTT